MKQVFKHTKRWLFITFIGCFGQLVIAQNVSISTNPGNPDPSAMLDIQSNNKGMLTPRMTLAEREAIIDPATGLLMYQIDEQKGFYYFDGNNWKAVGGQGGEFPKNLQVGQQDTSASIPSYTFDPINGGSSYDTSGVIYDSGGPLANYFNNQDSYFYIFPPNWPEMNPQLGVQLEIVHLDIHESDSLLVYLFGGISTDFYTLKGTITNLVLPVASDRVLLRFRTDGAITSSGFEIKFDWIYPSSDTTGGSSENVGWFFEPNKMAMRGGIDFIDAWNLDSIGSGSFAYGENVKAKGVHSIALGSANQAIGDNSIAIGKGAQADNYGAFALGDAEAMGINSIAMGNGARAINTNSVAIGDAYASGYQAVSLNGSANGSYSFSAGRNSWAAGISSIVFGQLNSAEGDFSFASGKDNTANSAYETVFGRYCKEFNVPDKSAWRPGDPLFVIGNGTAYNKRSNALTLDKNGHFGLGTANPNYPLHVISGNVNGGIQTMAMFHADSTNHLNLRLSPSVGQDFTLDYNANTSKLSFLQQSSLMTMDWNNGGRIGIGTSSPQSKLHLEGTLEIDNTIKANDVDGLSLATSDDVVRVKVQGSGPLFVEKGIMAMNTNSLSLENGNGQGAYISANGNVGIGILNPQSKLHVEGTLRVDDLIMADDVSGLRLAASNGIERMIVADNGNIGIGTSSPESMLHINGTLEVDDQIRADDNSGLNFASDEGSVRLHLNDNGRIGIGTTSPDAQLAVNAIGANDAMRVRVPAGTRLRLFNNGKVRIGINGGAGTAQLNINGVDGDDPLIVQENSVTHFMVHDNGGVSIGNSTAPSAQGIRVAGSYAGKSGGGSWSAISDIRLKDVHEEYTDGLSSLLKIRPVKYAYNEKAGYDTNEEHVGVVAQELEKIAPYMVESFEKEGEDYLSVDNSDMIYMLINSVKEQQKMIEELKAEVKELKRK
jgi:hypothetical protein